MDGLTQFLSEFLKNAGPIGLVPFTDAPVVHRVEDVTSILWYRRGPFQVQLFATPPNYVIPEHTHPHVDSYEVLLGGDMKFSKHGRWVEPEDLTFRLAESSAVPGSHPFRGSCIRVLPSDLHGGVSGGRGAVFLSVQHWQDGVSPHCVASDYSGKTMGDHHQAAVRDGEPVNGVAQAQLTWRDAAGREEQPPAFLGMPGSEHR
jgi:hypothetical protein